MRSARRGGISARREDGAGRPRGGGGDSSTSRASLALRRISREPPGQQASTPLRLASTAPADHLYWRVQNRITRRLGRWTGPRFGEPPNVLLKPRAADFTSAAFPLNPHEADAAKAAAARPDDGVLSLIKKPAGPRYAALVDMRLDLVVDAAGWYAEELEEVREELRQVASTAHEWDAEIHTLALERCDLVESAGEVLAFAAREATSLTILLDAVLDASESVAQVHALCFGTSPLRHWTRSPPA